MDFVSTDLAGVTLIYPQIHPDKRGFFAEVYRTDQLVQFGIRDKFVQENISSSQKGTLRGLHWQSPPHAQAKLVRVLRGKIFDVVVDLRKNSKTFGQWRGFELDAASLRMLYVPEGLAHGFLALEDHTEVLYKVSRYYAAMTERGIAWNDPVLNIEWPKLNQSPLVSPKDQRHPRFAEIQNQLEFV